VIRTIAELQRLAYENANEQDVTAPPITRAERERLRGLCEAATPGPWHFGRSPDNVDAVQYFARGYAAGPPTPVFLVCVPSGDKPMNDEARFTAITGNGPTSEANALAITAMRNALPSLLTALDAAEARAERAEGLMREAHRNTEKFMLDAATAESALAALRAEAEGLRARLRAVVGAAVVKRPLVTADDVLAYNLSLAAAAEAATKKEGA